MSWISKPLGIAVMGALMVAPALAGHQGRSRVVVAPRVVVARPVVVRPRAYVYYGPSLYYGYGSPYYAAPYYYRYSYPYYAYAPGYAVGPGVGEVKIESHLKEATVYVDGGYVGPIGKFKRFGLKPGNHDIEMRDVTGRVVFSERVQVLVDRTVEIRSPA
jgi:hypothetical protein